MFFTFFILFIRKIRITLGLKNILRFQTEKKYLGRHPPFRPGSGAWRFRKVKGNLRSMGFNLSRYFIKYFILACLFMILLGPTSALANGLVVEATLGFNGTFKLNSWTPLTVVIENRHRGIQGILEIVVTSGSEYQNDVYQTNYTMDVDLPTYSKKTYGLTILIDSYVHPLIIRLRKGKEVLFSESINLREHYTTKPLLLFAGDNLQNLSPMVTEDFQTVYTPARYLPETWYGYQGIKGLILKASLWKNLQPKQYAGLAQWIKTGGYVITAGGLQESSFPLERLEQLMPLRVVGLEQVREISALRAFCGYKLIHRDPFLLLKITAPPSETILRDGDRPLILEKGVGLGKLLFFAFDVTDSSFRDWPGRGAFWEKIWQMGPVADAAHFQPEAKKLFSPLLSRMPARFPSFLILFPLLLGYVLLINLFLKRIPQKRTQALKDLLPLTLAVLLFSSACFGLSWLTQTRYKLSSNGILHLKITGPQAPAQWNYYLGIYTQKDGEFRFPLGPEDPLLTSIPPALIDAYQFYTYTLHESRGVRSLRVPLHRWSHRFFSLTGFRELPLQAQARFQEEGISLSIENRSSFSILNCLVYFGGRLFTLGNIGPEERLNKRLSLTPQGPGIPFTPREVEVMLKAGLKDGPMELEMEMTKNLWFSIQERSQYKIDRIFLVGWIDSQSFPSPAKPENLFPSRVHILEWEIPLET